MSTIELAQQVNDVDEETRAISIVSDFLRQEDDLRDRLIEIGEKIKKMDKMSNREIIKKYTTHVYQGA